MQLRQLQESLDKLASEENTSGQWQNSLSALLSKLEAFHTPLPEFSPGMDVAVVVEESRRLWEKECGLLSGRAEERPCQVRVKEVKSVQF